MTDCFFFPDDPACNAPEVAPEGDDMRRGMEGDVGMMRELDPMSGQITYTLVALGAVVSAAMDLFRYRPSTFYDSYDTVSDTNWWKYANLVGSYAGLTLGSVAFITQVLSIFGIAAEINIMVWMYGVSLGGLIIGMITGALRLWAYEQAWSSAEDGTNGASSIAYNIRQEMVEVSAMSSSSTLALWTEAANWWAAQMMALPQDKEAMMNEQKDEMLSLFNF